MQRSPIPFNIALLELTPQKLQGLKPVTSLDIFDGASSNFSEEGLYSVSIFGKVGDDRRSNRFSYIDIKIPIFHPIIYRALLALKRLYGGIISGSEYAVWDESIKDFERSDPINGKTGFYFFTQYWKQIDYGDTKSVMREQNVLMIKKYLEQTMLTKVIVMPAGMRDIEITSDGRANSDEINVFYRKLLSISNTISDSAVKSNQEILNTARYNLQLTFNELFGVIESMIDGKKKLIMNKWASRNIYNGTRNVVTAMDTSTSYLGAPGSVNFNSTIIGLYQLMKALLPISRYHIRNGFLSKVFTAVDAPVKLVNKKTMHMEEVQLKTQYFDRWMTDEGIEKVITAFGEESVRHSQLEIEGRYIGLLYKGPDKTFKIIQDIDEVPGTRSKLDVTPLTFCELLYLSCYRVLNDKPLFITRYPITGVGSVYPSKSLVRTTSKYEERAELDDNWLPMDSKHVAYVFPITGQGFVNSLSPHSAHLGRLAMDFI